MKSIMFIAGEASGDSNAAAVIRALKARAPELEIFGTGGPQMKAAGIVHVQPGIESLSSRVLRLMDSSEDRVLDKAELEAGLQVPGAGGGGGEVNCSEAAGPNDI